MTATSGPGISLMSEFSGLGYYAEIPGVIFDIQRVGPSTGLPTRTAQGDLLSIAFLSHGDTKQVMLFPGSVKECFELGLEAFELAEQLQSTVAALEQAASIAEAKLRRVLFVCVAAAALSAIKDGSDPRIQLELALLKAARPQSDLSLQALLFRIEQLERRLAQAGAGGSEVPEAGAPVDERPGDGESSDAPA